MHNLIKGFWISPRLHPIFDPQWDLKISCKKRGLGEREERGRKRKKKRERARERERERWKDKKGVNVGRMKVKGGGGGGRDSYTKASGFYRQQTEVHKRSLTKRRRRVEWEVCVCGFFFGGERGGFTGYSYFQCPL